MTEEECELFNCVVLGCAEKVCGMRHVGGGVWKITIHVVRK